MPFRKILRSINNKAKRKAEMAGISSPLFEILAEQSNNIILLLDKNFYITSYNQAAIDFFQSQETTIKNKDYFVFCVACGKVPAFSREGIAKLAKGKVLYNRVYFNNRNYCLSWSIREILSADNKATGYLVVGKKDVTVSSVTDRYSNDTAFLNNLIRSIPGHIYLKGKDSVYIACNEMNAVDAGFPNSSGMLGKTDYDASWKEAAETFIQNDNEVFSTGEPKVLEETGEMTHGADRKSITVITHKVPLYDELNQVMGVLGTSVDITDYIEKAREKEIVYLESLMSNLPDNIYVIDEKGIYQNCNEQQLTNLGVTREKIVGKNVYEIAGTLGWDKDLANEIYKNNQEVIKSGSVISKEETIVCANGERRTYLSRKIPIKDRQAKCIGVLGISTDLTFLKNIENNLRESRAKTEVYLENLVSNLPDNIYWSNVDGVYEGCNDQQALMLNVTRKDVIGKTIYDVAKILNWDKSLADTIYENDQKVIRGKETITTEEDVVWLDGKKRTYLSRKIPTLDRMGNCIGVMGISTDITFLKETEKKLREAKEAAEAANLAKSEFLANMSHDVKTPLAGIVGLADVLRRSVSEENRQIAQEVMEAGQHVMRFFENCIELSKLENNTIDLSEDEFSLKEVIHEIFKLFLPSTKAKGLNLRISYADNIPARLLGSRINIYRTILNLIGNAIKFTAQGTITIRIKSMVNNDPEKVTIRLVVADTGIGIPANKKGVIFERFSRVTPSHQGTYEGSGIGLYIVHKFVTAVGGTIKIKSKIDKGSLFQVILPLKVASYTQESNNIDFSFDDIEVKSSISVPQKPVIEKRNENSFAHVLLVEDNSMAQKGAKTILESLGCKVDIAGSGKEAISLFYPGKYDLIFVDIGLPDIKGYDVAKRMRTMEQNTDKHTSILGLSAHAQLEEKKLSIDAGIDQMLSKPLLFEQAQELLGYYVFDKSLIPQKSPINDLAKMSSCDPKKLKAIDLQKKVEDCDSSNRRFSFQMLHKLVESLPESLREIEDAYKNQRMGTLQSAVHKLHGGLCYTPTPQLLQVTAEFDGCLKNEEYKKVDDLYKEFLNAVNSFEQAYQVLTDVEDLISAC